MESSKTNHNSLTRKQVIGWGLAITALSVYLGFAAHEEAKQQHERDMQYIATRTDGQEQPLYQPEDN